MIRRILVAVWVIIVMLLTGAAECDVSNQPSVKCGFFCQLEGGGGTHDPPAVNNPPKQKDLYDPDAHHQFSDKKGDRDAINQEKADNQKNLERMCKQTPSLCGR